MQKIQFIQEIMGENNFFDKVIKYETELQRKLIKNGVDLKSEYLLNKKDFYFRNVAISLVYLIDLCDKLNFCIIFFSSNSTTKEMEKYNVNVIDLLIHKVENYLIRTQSLKDGLLKLINDVYFLGNSEKNCKYNIILNNIYIKQSDIYEKIKLFFKEVGKYSSERNSIIHDLYLKNKDLEKLELFYLFQDKNNGIEILYENLMHDDSEEYFKEMKNEFLTEKREEYIEFNNTIFYLLRDIFHEMEKEFDKIYKSL